jgi:NADH dehydrogenase
MSRIIIVGGGAGGLELATQLGNKLGRRGTAEIVLVDRNPTHLWKPLLHEVATGSMDPGIDALSYSSHAHNHHFEFQLGTLASIDRDECRVVLAPLLDAEGHILLDRRELDYDTLVMALGSVSNDFGTPGVSEHCIFLDSPAQAERFRTALMNRLLRYSRSSNATEKKVEITLVGGGATGVELAAELYNAVEYLAHYGFSGVSTGCLKITLVEAGERILPALPERLSTVAHRELVKLGVDVRTETFVTEATAEGLKTREGDFIPGELMVWAAGIKAPDFLRDLDGLETNRANQLLVRETLQTTLDDNIFALGDCAACPQPDGRLVPPRAQSAHQMASRVYSNIRAQLRKKKLKPYRYTDHGSLVNLSRYSTVGSLMGNLTRGSMMIEGRIARTVYFSLYRMHQIALHGYMRTMLMMLEGRINRVLRPRLKLH